MTKESALDIYYVFGAISVLCSVYVILSICFQIGYETSPTKLLLCLHLTVVVENLTTLPNLYTDSSGLCAFLGFLRTYFGFANAIVVFMIVFHYRYIFIVDQWKIKDFVSKHREQIIFFAPVITLLPFLSNGYGALHSIWCSIKEDNFIDNTWSFVVYYGWIIGIVGISSLLMLHTVIQVYLADPTIASSLMKSIGLYAIISILSWFPRCLSRFGVVSDINSNIFLYFSSIAYFITFQFEKNSLKAFEDNVVRFNAAQGSDNGSVYISWEFDSTFFRSSSRSDENGTPRSSMGKKSPSSHHQSLIGRSIQKISSLVLGGVGNSATKSSQTPSSGSAVNSAHSSANRGEISPIDPQSDDVHNIILESAPTVVHHRNRPISANLVSLVADEKADGRLGTDEKADRHPNSDPPEKTDKTSKRFDFINYQNIAKYNMNVDDLARPKTLSRRQTPAKPIKEDLVAAHSQDLENSKLQHPPSRPTSRPASLRLNQNESKRPQSVRLNVINKVEGSSSTIVESNNTISEAEGKEIKLALANAYRSQSGDESKLDTSAPTIPPPNTDVYK